MPKLGKLMQAMQGKPKGAKPKSADKAKPSNYASMFSSSKAAPPRKAKKGK